METFSAFPAICAGNSPVPGEFPTQRPVTRSFDVFFDLLPNNRLSKQSWCWWFEMPSRSLWRHRNGDNCRSGDSLGAVDGLFRMIWWSLAVVQIVVVTHIGDRHQTINSMWPSNVIWRHEIGSGSLFQPAVEFSPLFFCCCCCLFSFFVCFCFQHLWNLYHLFRKFGKFRDFIQSLPPHPTPHFS